MFLSLLLNDVGIYLSNGSFRTDVGFVILHQSEGNHWVCYINENYFDSYGCVCPKKLSKFTIKRNGHCLYSEYKVQGLTSKRGSYCASCSLYIVYLTNV